MLIKDLILGRVAEEEALELFELIGSRITTIACFHVEEVPSWPR